MFEYTEQYADCRLVVYRPFGSKLWRWQIDQILGDGWCVKGSCHYPHDDASDAIIEGRHELFRFLRMTFSTANVKG